MDRRAFTKMFAESLVVLAVACDTGKENTSSGKFNEVFDDVFGGLEKNQKTIQSVVNNLRFTAQLLRWSDGRASGMDVLFQGIRPNERVAIAHYIDKPGDIFVEDAGARTIVFGDGNSGRYALYTSKGNPEVRAFSEGGAADVPADKLDGLIGELRIHYKNKRTR